MTRLLVPTALVMVAFAGNSLLNRAALAGSGAGPEAGPAAFAAIRLGSGAVTLILLASLRRAAPGVPWRAPRRAAQVLALLAYMLCFSFAYLTLPAGVGALILFGGVQVTMFAGALLSSEPVPARRWIGAGVALAGLAFLLWPAGVAAPDPPGAALMAAAAVGWGVYSLLGRGSRDPLGATAANFALALVPAAVLAALAFDGLTPRGAALAVASGAVTSGLGYALWYAVLPRLPASTAALSQLSVPVIAVVGGVLLLGETLTLRMVLSAMLVVAGVSWGVSPGNQGTIRSRGS